MGRSPQVSVALGSHADPTLVASSRVSVAWGSHAEFTRFAPLVAQIFSDQVNLQRNSRATPSQQQSYMVNKYNKENPESAIHIDRTGEWQEAPTYNEDSTKESMPDNPVDPHEGLCKYEIQRLNRVRENASVVASLGIKPMSEIE